MKMMTKALEKTLPLYHSQDWLKGDAICYAHYFYWGRDWYVLEYDKVPKIFFGIVIWHDTEYWDFGLAELESTGKVERDLYWTPKKVCEIDKLKNFIEWIYPTD